MSEKNQVKCCPRFRYSYLPIIATTIILTLSGTFQLSFQDIYYEYYHHAFGPGQNDEMYYLSVEVQPKNRSLTLADTKFLPQVTHTSLYFHFGVAIGSLLFGLIFLRLGAKWSFVIFSGIGILTSTLIALGDVMDDHFLLLTIIRSIYGVCIGFLTCLQISVLNDIAFDEDQDVFNMCTIFSISLGGLTAYFGTRDPVTSKEIWYGGHLISIFPLFLGFLYFLIFFREPPSTLIIKGNVKKAMKSAQHWYGDFYAGYAFAETHNRVNMNIKKSLPTLFTIWSDKISRKALFLAALVNVMAGLSGDRFTWIFLYRYSLAHGFKTNSLSLVLSFTFMGFAIYTILTSKWERKCNLIITAVLVAILELTFGSFWQFSSSVDDETRFIVGESLRSAQHLFFTTGLNSIAYFIAPELSFSVNKTILVSISFTLRAITMAFYPYIFGLLYGLSPMGASFLSAIPLIGCAIFIGLRFPRLSSLTSYQLLQTFGYTVNLEATPEEIQNVRKNMHKLWQNPKES